MKDPSESSATVSLVDGSGDKKSNRSAVAFSDDVSVDVLSADVFSWKALSGNPSSLKAPSVGTSSVSDSSLETSVAP